VPSGTSTGKYEVNVFGRDVSSSIGFFNKELKQKVVGKGFANLADIFAIEKQLEGYIPEIGGNIVLAISYALLRNLNRDVYRVFGGKTIPFQVCNIIGGGKHAGGTEFQEFLAIPMTKDYPKSIAASKRIHTLAGEKLGAEDVGLEGAWVSNLSNEESLEALHDVAGNVSKEFGFDIKLGLDVAASEFYKGDCYIYKDRKLDRGEQIDFILGLIKRFNLHYVEDPLEQEDFEGFAEIQKKTKCLICGDDLFATNIERLKPVCKAAIVKPNQVGMLHKVVGFMEGLKKHSMTSVVSHRSQETKDDILADLAVGLGAPYLKLSVKGAERIVKMHRLNDIHGELNG
jgi:enolase